MTREYASFGMELARASTSGSRLTGYASVFNYPIETMETWLNGTVTYMRPGAFTKTLKDNAPKEEGGPWGEIQSLFNHGRDPRYGELPIGRVVDLHEDSHGLYAEVELHDGPDNENIKAALGSGALRSMSIAFEMIKDKYSDDRSQRDINEVRLFEFGPVTFPANQAATAALHSMSAVAVIGADSTPVGAAATDSAGSTPDAAALARIELHKQMVDTLARNDEALVAAFERLKKVK